MENSSKSSSSQAKGVALLVGGLGLVTVGIALITITTTVAVFIIVGGIILLLVNAVLQVSKLQKSKEEKRKIMAIAIGATVVAVGAGIFIGWYLYSIL